MDKMDIYTKLIPGLMLAALIGYNMFKLQRSLKAMKQEHCNGACQGCAQRESCTSSKKQKEEKK